MWQQSTNWTEILSNCYNSGKMVGKNTVQSDQTTVMQHKLNHQHKLHRKEQKAGNRQQHHTITSQSTISLSGLHLQIAETLRTVDSAHVSERQACPLVCVMPALTQKTQFEHAVNSESCSNSLLAVLTNSNGVACIKEVTLHNGIANFFASILSR